MANKSTGAKKRLGATTSFSKLNRNWTPWFVFVAALILLVACGSLWWAKIFTNQQRVFDDMLANNLSTKSVARRVVQQDQASKVDQTTYVSFRGPEVADQSVTVLTQQAQDKTTTVKTETIGNQNNDFVRYISAEGTENISSGNLQSILGVWGQRTADPNKGQQAAFLNEAVFTIVPFGNLTPVQRSELLSLMKQNGTYTITRAQREYTGGRYVYGYTVSIKPASLVDALAKYVELTGENTGESKLVSARKYGTKIIGEKDMLELIG